MFGITYDAHADMDGKFQVIGEIESGWDSLIEIECACVQPVAYYYPNNQHLMALAEQTGADRDPLLLERIALGLQVTRKLLFWVFKAQISFIKFVYNCKLNRYYF